MTRLVVIIVEGGVVQEVYGDIDMEAVVIDYDNARCEEGGVEAAEARQAELCDGLEQIL